MESTAILFLGLLAGAGLLLLWGGSRQLRHGDRQKGWLMLAAGVIMIGNVLIWLV